MDKTHSRYGDLLDKAMQKKEDRMLASAMRIRDNINAENKRKEQDIGKNTKKNIQTKST